MLLYLFILTIGELVSQFFLKLAQSTQTNILYLIIGVFLYGAVGYIYYLSLFETKMASISVSWHVVMTLVTILISISYFKESYTIQELVGLAMGVLSLILLHNGH
jgi:uncharacterized membrane protein